MAELKSILLAEDNPKDVELTLTALGENNLVNALKEIGVFWALLNERAPGSVRKAG